MKKFLKYTFTAFAALTAICWFIHRNDANDESEACCVYDDLD